MELNIRYSFSVKSPAIISGTFSSVKLLKILPYVDAVVLDNSIPNIQELLGVIYPERLTYYVFEKAGNEIVVCRDWIMPETIIEAIANFDQTYAIKDISIEDKEIIEHWLNSMNYIYVEA